MAKTAAENQAAYRKRRAEKGSAEITGDGKAMATEVVEEMLSSTVEGTTLSPGADCVPEDTGNEIDLSIPDAGVDPDPVIAKLDELLNLMREIPQHITHLLMEVPTETPFRFHSSFNETRPDEEVPNKPARGGAPEPVGDLTQCMKCEAKLPPTETPRLVRELCHDCVWRKTG